MCIKKFFADRKIEKQIRHLSAEERREILEKSPLEAGAFQGEGFHVFLKSEPDFEKAYVTSLGEVTKDVAEDWIIRQYLVQQRNFNQYRTEKSANDWARR